MTSRKNTSRIQWYHYGPFTVNTRVLGPLFGETVYISKVKAIRKVKSDAQVAINKNSNPMHQSFLRGGWGRQYPQLNFFQTSLIVRNESRLEAHIRVAG